MKRSTLVAALVCVASLTACLFEDFGSERVVKEPTGPSFSVSGGSTEQASTVCQGYSKERNAVATELQSAPSDSALAEKLASLDAMLNDACR